MSLAEMPAFLAFLAGWSPMHGHRSTRVRGRRAALAQHFHCGAGEASPGTSPAPSGWQAPVPHHFSSLSLTASLPQCAKTKIARAPDRRRRKETQSGSIFDNPSNAILSKQHAV